MLQGPENCNVLPEYASSGPLTSLIQKEIVGIKQAPPPKPFQHYVAQCCLHEEALTGQHSSADNG